MSHLASLPYERAAIRQGISVHNLRRYTRRYANHHLDSARWAVMHQTYSVPCSLCRHEHSPDYSHAVKVDGKPVTLCPECNAYLLANGDILTRIDLIYDERYEDGYGDD